MNSQIESARVWLVLAAGVLFITFSASTNAQVQTQTSTTSGAATQEVTVERGEVVAVSGNDLVVKMEDGSLRNFENVPESARATVDGQEVGIHDLKPGMKLQKTVTVTTTPQVIKTVQTVKGKVWHISPPSSVILRLEDNTTQQFKIPQGQKFIVNGHETDAWGLKKGMLVSATKITEEPITVVEHERQISGSTPPPPLPPPADQPILVAVATPAPAPAPAAPEELPKTGSTLPLIGLLGGLATFASLGLGMIRRTF